MNWKKGGHNKSHFKKKKKKGCEKKGTHSKCFSDLFAGGGKKKNWPNHLGSAGIKDRDGEEAISF